MAEAETLGIDWTTNAGKSVAIRCTIVILKSAPRLPFAAERHTQAVESLDPLRVLLCFLSRIRSLVFASLHASCIPDRKRGHPTESQTRRNHANTDFHQ